MAEENMTKGVDEAAEEVTEDTKAAGEGAAEEETSVQEEAGSEEAAAEEEKEGEEDSAGTKKAKKDKNEELIEELTDRVKRQMAEFENFRKRTEKEKAGMFELGAKSVIEQILPVIHNFERGIGSISEEAKADPFVDGMDKIYRQMLEVLDKLGVKPIEAVGSEFDPDFHNAVMHVDDGEAGDNVVVEEFLKGYMYHDTVVRHSMVKVAN